MNTKQRRKLRNRLAESQGWRCCYCACPLTPETATLEHLEPVSKGGPNGAGNLAAACQACNELAADFPARAKRGILRNLMR